MTCPLITKADGSTGKAKVEMFITADKTLDIRFTQFWLNTTDVDAEKYIKIFILDKTPLMHTAEHKEMPHLVRVLQKLPRSYCFGTW
jgi:tyrosyl-tRNA synthetase